MGIFSVIKKGLAFANQSLYPYSIILDQISSRFT